MTDFTPSAGRHGVAEVAQAAGVSIATVSRVMNHPHLVAPGTRDRVRSAMERLDFQVNLAASGLRRGDFHTVAVIVASLSQPWYSKIVRAIRAELKQRGYGTLIFDLEHDPEGLKEYLNSATGQGSSGVIVSTGDYLDTPVARDALERARAKVPLVVAGQHVAGATWPTVQFGDREGARVATDHLLDEAGAPVAFLGDLANSYHGHERRSGYEDALRNRGIDPDPWVWPLSSFHFAAGYEETMAQLKAGAIPRSIIAVNDELALGICRAIADFGLRVPEDVAVLGFGDTPFLPYVTPSLSSVNGSVEEIALLACNALWEMFAGGDPRGVTVVSRALIVRESSVSKRRAGSAEARTAT